MVGCKGGGSGAMKTQVDKILMTSATDKICREMLRTTVMESESIVRKVISGIVCAD